MGDFIDKTVLITGGARGMGASHARGFAEQGAHVIVADVLEDEGRALAAGLGQRATFVRLDVTSPSGWAAGIEAAETASGPIGVLVNNAGIHRVESIEDGDLGTWRRVVDINLLGVYLGMRAVIPSMRRSGGSAIINISSITGTELVIDGGMHVGQALQAGQGTGGS